jgi:hypothetical protein
MFSMNMRMFTVLGMALCLSACTSFRTPSDWPVEVEADREIVGHTIEQVRFVGSTHQLTKPERALLTFLNDSDNIADSVGKKNRPGDHQWLAAEIYRVDPGRHISVLCENGYQQVAAYFHYRKEDGIWYRVGHLEDRHGKGIPAVKVKLDD